MFQEFGEIQRAELLKQECHTGKVASNTHRLGPKSTQKVATELKNNTTVGGASRRPIVFQLICSFCVFFVASLCMLLTTLPV